MEGGKDPFNRRPYPWGREDTQLQAHFRTLGQLRKDHAALRTGDTKIIRAGEGYFGFVRSLENRKLRIYVNHSKENWQIPAGKPLFAKGVETLAPDWLALAPMGMCVLEDM